VGTSCGTVCWVQGRHVAISTHRVATRDEEEVKCKKCDSPQERHILCSDPLRSARCKGARCFDNFAGKREGATGVLRKEEITPRDVVAQLTSITSSRGKGRMVKLVELPHLTVHQKLGLARRCPGQPTEVSRTGDLSLLPVLRQGDRR
jgi:hypothetical protein